MQGRPSAKPWTRLRRAWSARRRRERGPLQRDPLAVVQSDPYPYSLSFLKSAADAIGNAAADSFADAYADAFQLTGPERDALARAFRNTVANGTTADIDAIADNLVATYQSRLLAADRHRADRERVR